MELAYSALLAVCSFWLGSCPFSFWIGQQLLKKDIRKYGDGNPGAANVFRAGGVKSGYLAAIMDTAKGIPFVFLAQSYFGFPHPTTVIVAICAILGHAFSPFLRFRGGKSVAVTMGALLALPQHEMLITMIIFLLAGVLLLESHSWVVISAAAGSLVFLAVTRAEPLSLILMLGIFSILLMKHFEDLKSIPRMRGILVRWLLSRRREA